MGQKRIDLMSVAEFDAAFPDRETCTSFLVGNRWPDGVGCPRCGGEARRNEQLGRWHWECAHCPADRPRSFYVRSGTVFDNTHLSLRTWLKAVHLLLISRKVLGPAEMQRLLGLTSFQTAWYVCDRIRASLADETFLAMLGLAKDAKVRRHAAAAERSMAWKDKDDDKPRTVETPAKPARKIGDTAAQG